MKTLKIPVFLSLLILLFTACGEEEMSEADYIKQASFTDFEGNTVEVADFEDKVVMIDFWETWCKPCLASFPTMQKVLEENSEDFVILAVTPGFVDTQEDAQQFVNEHDYDFRFLMDTNKLHEKLGVQGIPFKVYIDADGNFIKTSMGSGGEQAEYEELTSLIEENKAS